MGICVGVNSRRHAVPHARLVPNSQAMRAMRKSEQDAINQNRARIIEAGWATEDELKKMEKDIGKAVRVRQALAHASRTTGTGVAAAASGQTALV